MSDQAGEGRSVLEVSDAFLKGISEKALYSMSATQVGLIVSIGTMPQTWRVTL